MNIAKLFSGSGEKLYLPEYSAETVHSARFYLNMNGKSCNNEINSYYVNIPASDDVTSEVNLESQNIDMNVDDIVNAIHPTFYQTCLRQLNAINDHKERNK